MVISAQRAIETISRGDVASGYLLLGQELYWRDRVWAALRQAVGLESGGAGIEEMDLRQTSLEAILARAAERSLWTPRQLLLVRNAQSLALSRSLELAQDYFRNPSPDTVLVFEMDDVDLDAADWREREKIKTRQEHWESFCEVVLLASPPLRESIAIVQQEAAARGGKIAPEAAERLLAFCDRDLGRVVMELEKLCLYANGSEIRPEAVELLSGRLGSAPAMSLPEAIGSGDASKLLEALAALVPKGAYLPLTLAEVTRYLRQLLLLQQRRIRDPREASRILWSARLPAPPALLPELLRQARAFPPAHLLRCFREAWRAEQMLRSSPADERLVVERFLLTMAAPLRERRTEARLR
ncbi:MAG TPA: DNA polymerase III subunit delta [Terriglobia bacterium]|nr:DNA polymerase III subunit delta [Terriglobia bacterium]